MSFRPPYLLFGVLLADLLAFGLFPSLSVLPGDILPVRRSELDSVYKTAKDVRLKDLVTPSSFNLQTLDLSDKDKNVLKLKKENESRWSFVEPKYGDAEYEGDAAPHAPGAH